PASDLGLDDHPRVRGGADERLAGSQPPIPPTDFIVALGVGEDVGLGSAGNGHLFALPRRAGRCEGSNRSEPPSVRVQAADGVFWPTTGCSSRERTTTAAQPTTLNQRKPRSVVKKRVRTRVSATRAATKTGVAVTLFRKKATTKRPRT